MKSRAFALVLLTLAFVALFATAPSQAAPMDSSAAASCASLEKALGSDSGNSLDFTWLTGTGCLSGFCQTVADCPCSTATSISCNGTCHYTFSGGGGGSNPHGCFHGFCTTSSNCRCSDGTFAACVGGVCSF